MAHRVIKYAHRQWGFLRVGLVLWLRVSLHTMPVPDSAAKTRNQLQSLGAGRDPRRVVGAIPIQPPLSHPVDLGLATYMVYVAR